MVWRNLLKSGINVACSKVGEALLKVFATMFFVWTFIAFALTIIQDNMAYMLAPLAVLVSFTLVFLMFENACSEANRKTP